MFHAVCHLVPRPTRSKTPNKTTTKNQTISMSKVHSIVIVAVAVVFALLNLAACQGPPMYFQPGPPPIDGPPFAGPPAMPMNAPPFIQRAEYMGPPPSHPPPPEMMDKESIKKAEAEAEKFEKKDKKDAAGGEKLEYGASTPAPGVLGSFQSSVSDAWKSISSLGRTTRSVPTDSEKLPSEKARSLDNYEYIHYNNQGYIYFKVPKHLVCQ